MVKSLASGDPLAEKARPQISQPFVTVVRSFCAHTTVNPPSLSGATAGVAHGLLPELIAISSVNATPSAVKIRA